MGIHGRTGTRGNNDGKLPGKHLGTMAGDFPRGIPIAGIEGGLAAARLVHRVFHGDTEMLQDLHGGAGHIVIKGITQAGAHEELSLIHI